MVDIEGTDVVDGIDVTLLMGASISGTITVPEGIYVTGVNVRVYEADQEYDAVAYAGVLDNATFIVRGLPVGAYKVKFDAGNSGALSSWFGDTQFFEEAQLLDVSQSEAVTEINAFLIKAASISGMVTVPLGASAERVQIAVYTADGDQHHDAYGQVYDDGTYIVNGLTSGAYKLLFWGIDAGVVSQWYGNSQSLDEAETITVAVGHARSGVDVSLEAAFDISGTVHVPEGVDVTSIGVDVYGAEAEARSVGYGSVDEDGTYTVYGPFAIKRG